MNNKRRGILPFIILLACAFTDLGAQVTIGSGISPAAGALLDLKEKADGSSTKGLGMSCVNLTDVSNLFPMFEIVPGSGVANAQYNVSEKKTDEDKKHVGLIVYNINQLSLDGQGLYIWDGQQWQQLGNPSGSTGGYRISLSQSIKRLSVTGEHTLTATINSPQPETIVWSSDRPGIATVDQNGKITAKAKGEAKIKATYGDGSRYAECSVEVYTQTNYSYRYRLTLIDKGDYSGHSISAPLGFLNQRSIDRRIRQNIAIDVTDLPISQGYLQIIESVGGPIVAKSKWLNTVTVYCTEEFMNKDFEALPFVTGSELVWRGDKNGRSLPAGAMPKQLERGDSKLSSERETTPSKTPRGAIDYGRTDINIAINKGKILHDEGFKGEGMEIAVIDDGFGNVDKISHFSKMNIAGTKSFVYGQPDIYDPAYWHGTEVLSCLAANTPGTHVGTAPNARYWLFRSEDNTIDWPIEEDYWVMAAEYADSVGVDLINTSIGYGKVFYMPEMNYKHSDTNGKTIFMSRGANMSADKGILVICSAGNDGNGWVDTPGEALGVLTVGGVNKQGALWVGTSRGLTADGRVKPDVLAMGAEVPVIESNGAQSNYNGTSFSSPILCGLAACLWQAYPELTSKELLDVIKKSSDTGSSQPEIANMEKAFNTIKSTLIYIPRK